MGAISFALHIARYLILHLKQSSGQTRFLAHLRMQKVPAIERVQSWCLDNPGGERRVSMLRASVRISERDFSRKFRQETGLTVAAYVTSVRMDAASRLLMESGLSAKVVAARSGSGSTASLRRAFLERFGVASTWYRENFVD